MFVTCCFTNHRLFINQCNIDIRLHEVVYAIELTCKCECIRLTEQRYHHTMLLTLLLKLLNQYQYSRPIFHVLRSF